MVTYPSTSRSGQELNSCPLSRKSSALTTRLSIVSDIAIFVLKRDVKLQPTNWTIEPPPNDDGKISALLCTVYGDGAGNTVEENSGIFSLIQMR